MRMTEGLDDIVAWRHELHRNPELLYDLPRTAAFVADKLRAFGCDEVATGVGRAGVVGVIRGTRRGNRTVALRADMDALPITEAPPEARAHASTVAGRMHACGHDGHTAMLLGAARHLCDTRAFAGTAIVVFQPAEEGGAGARAMLNDGLVSRFGIDEIYGMHNLPGLPVGQFATRPGPIMASSDTFDVTVSGKGGHAAMPHLSIDPIVIAAEVILALQTIASRRANPLEGCVVSVTRFEAGTARGVIPEAVTFGGTVRTLTAATRDLAEERVGAIARGIADAHGATASVRYGRGYPVTVNDAAAARFAAAAATSVAGADKVDGATAPMMGAEDFSFMLEARPGAFIFTGNGDSAPLHHGAYDFSDAAIPHGVNYWLQIVAAALPLDAAV